MKITIIGSGAYGTALAQVLSDNDHDVILYGINLTEIIDINENSRNSQYFYTKLNKSICATNNFEFAIKDTNLIICAIPSPTLPEIINKINKFLKYPAYFVCVTKGISDKLLVADFINLKVNIKRELNLGIVGLYGPTFAKEVVNREISYVVAVSNDKSARSKVVDTFNNEYFHVSESDDEIGIPIIAASKNVLAIIGALVKHVYNSIDTWAAIISLGYKELSILVKALGGKTESMMAISGIGDLLLTVSSEKSRNYRLGEMLATPNLKPSQALKACTFTVEGVQTCLMVHKIAQKLNLSMPIFEIVYQILVKDRYPRKVLSDYFRNK